MSWLTNKPFVFIQRVEENSLKQQNCFSSVLFWNHTLLCVNACVCACSRVERAYSSYLHGSHRRHHGADWRHDTHSSGLTRTLLRTARFWQRAAASEPWDIFGPCFITAKVSRSAQDCTNMRHSCSGFTEVQEAINTAAFRLKHTDGRGLLTGFLTLSLTWESNCLGCLATGPEPALDPLTPCQSVSICFLLFGQNWPYPLYERTPVWQYRETPPFGLTIKIMRLSALCQQCETSESSNWRSGIVWRLCDCPVRAPVYTIQISKLSITHQTLCNSIANGPLKLTVWSKASQMHNETRTFAYIHVLLHWESQNWHKSNL